LAEKKPTPAEIELQLSERRFLLEAINASSSLLQVPIVTAFVWYYVSRTNPTLSVLNKAILAAELTPLIGDIKFPEGVLLGAAMESTDDMLAILDKAGILDTTIEDIKNSAIDATQDTGDFLVDQLLRVIPDRKCEHWAGIVHEKYAKAIEGNLFAGIDWLIAAKKMKKQKCDRPPQIPEYIWQKI